MKSGFSAYYLLFVQLGLVALFNLLVGLRGVRFKKPFLISSRWFLSVLAGSPLMFLLYTLILIRGETDLTYLRILYFWLAVNAGVLFACIGFFPRGYIGYGMTKSLFQQGLINSLERLGIPFEETHRGMNIQLSSVSAHLKVVVQSSTAHVTIRPQKFNFVLRDIVSGMNNYYQTTNVSINLTFFYRLLIVSALSVLLIAFLNSREFSEIVKTLILHEL